MITRTELTTYLDTYLDINIGTDSSWNGLQVEGKNEVTTLAVAVDAGIETFQQAVKVEAEFLLVHHGLFWEFDNPSLVGWRGERLKNLRDHELSLYAAHLPLDRHAQVGNNAQLLRLIGAKRVADFMIRDDMSVSGIGELSTPLPLAALEEKLTEELGAVCTTLPFGPKTISRVAVATGHGGYSGFYEALKAGVDLYLTGDTSELYHTAKDARINVIFAGHYATETLGVQALARHLGQHFNLPTHFIDLPTGL